MSAVPPGSLILVTGANGFIASHVVDLLLARGFRIRAAIRTAAKGQWLQEYADKTYGAGKLELVIVPDMFERGAYNEAVKGCSGIVHVASDLTFSPDPNFEITGAVNNVRDLLDAAAAEPLMRRFVYTSSTTALFYPKPNTVFPITADMWNEEAIAQAWAPPPYEMDRAVAVYGASKAQTEQAVFEYAREKKPAFAVNSVIPNTAWGPLVWPERQQPPPSSAKWLLNIFYRSEFPVLPGMGLTPPQHAVDVRDTARLHVAGLVDPDVRNERMFAIAEPYSWKQVLEILKELKPEHDWPEGVEDQGSDMAFVPDKEKMEDILRRNFGVDGFTSLKEMLRASIEQVEVPKA